MDFHMAEVMYTVLFGSVNSKYSSLEAAFSAS